MRPLNAFQTDLYQSDFAKIKAHALVFDKFYIATAYGLSTDIFIDMPCSGLPFLDEIDYLKDAGIVRHISEAQIYQSLDASQPDPAKKLYRSMHILPSNVRVRNLSAWIAYTYKEDVVPVIYGKLQEKLPDAVTAKIGTDLLSIVFSQMPVPGDGAAWQDIIDFKSEEGDQLWAFRRFLFDLSVKKQSEAEIRDDFEWSMNEYRKFMKLQKLKTQDSFLETYAIPTLEVLENLAKLNFSKIAKDALGVRKRRIELLEAEIKAPGRECAYVFNAQERFDGGTNPTVSPSGRDDDDGSGSRGSLAHIIHNL